MHPSADRTASLSHDRIDGDVSVQGDANDTVVVGRVSEVERVGPRLLTS